MENHNRLAIMQPYVFPNLGYFHLIQASSEFVFYDDVNFIKKGWINRNKIMVHGKELLFTIPLKGVSQNKLINEIEPVINSKFQQKFFSTVEIAYKKAPNFAPISKLLNEVLKKEYNNVADLAIESIVSVYNYLEIPFHWKKSSVCSPHTRGLDKADRLINITKELGYHQYINANGGQNIYSKDYFKSKHVDLVFISNQYNNELPDDFKFSIIDLLMKEEIEVVKEKFSSYNLL